ncbi:uncharacterized protein LOC112558803 isoform X1 [Pomacea canaliculata]|uniref:uncharacterized protein LOC112558803 isoform X1 n=2 Tax=Pomacea canaliculata TaxID=400727 RepID=UPI000D73BFA0|nr:uncharacterized protein LOC112558803 isoform X1 [Pomacea canaliculata]
MARQLIFIIISYAVFFFLHVQALDCGNRASTIEAQQKCFSDEGLEMDSNKISEVGIIVPLNLTAACRNKDKYKQAIICAFGIRKQCLKSVDESTSILPDDSSLVEGTDYVCQHVKALEDSCLHTADSGMKECAETKKQSQRNYDADSQNIVCSSLQIAYECAQEKLEVCSSETLQAVLDIIDKYFRPPACSAFDNKPNLLTSLPVVSCSSQFSIHQGQEECFTREGIAMYLPQFSTSGQSQSKQSAVESFTQSIDELQKLCRDLSRYQRAVVCATQVGLQCLPAEYRDYSPTAENVKFYVKSICDNINVTNLECMKEVGSRIYDCGYQKGLSYANKDSITDFLCYAYSANTECLSGVLPTCGCPTTKVYVETSKLYMNGPACSPITVKTPVCDPKTNKFLDSAATMLHGMSLLILTALVVCGLYNAM